MSNKFAVLANLWTYSQVSGEYNDRLRAVVLSWAKDPWDWEYEGAVFAEIDTITSGFALFANSIQTLTLQSEI